MKKKNPHSLGYFYKVNAQSREFWGEYLQRRVGFYDLFRFAGAINISFLFSII